MIQYTQTCADLAALPRPYDIQKNDEEIFTRAMAAADDWHRRRNPSYAALWPDNGYASAQTPKTDAAHAVLGGNAVSARGPRPLLPVSLFKRENLNTPVDAPGQWLHSSGSGGKGATGVFFDALSMRHIEQAMGNIFLHNGLLSAEPSRFLILAPDPQSGGQPGYASAFAKFTACAPALERLFAVDGSGLNPELAWATLRRWSETPAPIYVFGLTVFFEQLRLSGSDPIRLRGPLRGITGGGWKGLNKTLSRPEVVAGLRDLLSAPLFDIRDIYGMTEHPLHYVSCAQGHFHIPRYSRFFLMGPDGQGAPFGTSGLIRLQNPFFASLPAHDLLTEDVGVAGQDCACGNALPYLVFQGRATSPEGTCAHGATS